MLPGSSAHILCELAWIFFNDFILNKLLSEKYGIIDVVKEGRKLFMLVRPLLLIENENKIKKIVF